MHALSSVIDDASQKKSFHKNTTFEQQWGMSMYIERNTRRSLAGSRSVGRLLLKGSRDGRSVAGGLGVARDLFVKRLQLWNFVSLNKRPEEDQSTTQLTSLSSRLLSLLLLFSVTAFALVAFLFLGVLLLTCLVSRRMLP